MQRRYGRRRALRAKPIPRLTCPPAFAWSTPVNVFLDTKFTDFKDCELISIGLVSEDGAHQFYAERSDFLLARCNEWVLGNILPLLGWGTASSMSRRALHDALWSWFEALPEPAVLLFDYSTDWCLLAEALLSQGQHRIPASIASTQSIAELKKESLFADTMARYYANGHPRHHALTDAQAQRVGWLAWKWSQDVADPPHNSTTAR